MFGPVDPLSKALSIVVLILSVLTILLLIFSPVVALGVGGSTPVGMAAAVALFVCSTIPMLMNVAVVRRDNQ